MRFVDCHSHVVVSGDDGAQTVEEGAALCRAAARRGTGLLFATPHVWPELPLTRARAQAIEEAYVRVAQRAGLELRLGYELTPAARLLDDDLGRYRLEGTDCVLMEVPFVGSVDPLVALAEHTEAAGLKPVIAHPERSEAVLARPVLADELAERGWALQVNATSLLGYHGDAQELFAWRLLDRGAAALVASDGHRAARPPHLAAAYELVSARLGPAADRLFDGTALGVVAAEAPARSA